MALYNNATNLQSQGRFAPGANYRADIKEPKKKVDALPKARSVFNIDLQSIGNAMIRSAELETKMQQDELARQDKLYMFNREQQLVEDEFAADVALKEQEMEDLRNYRAADLAVKREGNWLSYQASMSKDKKTSSGKDQTPYHDYNQRLFKLSQKWEQNNTPMSQRRIEAARLDNEIFQQYDPSEVNFNTLNSIRENYGVASVGLRKANEEIEYNQAKADEEAFQNTREKSPWLQNMSYTDARAKYNTMETQTQAFMKYMATLNSAESTQAEKDAAFETMTKTGVNLSKYGILNKLYNSVTSGQMNGANPLMFKQALIQDTTNDFIRAGVDPLQARDMSQYAVDSMGVDRFVKDKLELAKTSKEYSENIASALLADNKTESILNIPGYATFSNFSPVIQQNYLENERKAGGNFLSSINGYIALNTSPTKAIKETGDIIINSKTISQEDYKAMQDATGLRDPMSAAFAYYYSTGKQTVENRYSNMSTDKQLVDVSNNLLQTSIQNSLSDNPDYQSIIEGNIIQAASVQKGAMDACENSEDKAICKLNYESTVLFSNRDVKESITNLLNIEGAWGAAPIYYKINGNSIELEYSSESHFMTDEPYKKLHDVVKNLNKQGISGIVKLNLLAMLPHASGKLLPMPDQFTPWTPNIGHEGLGTSFKLDSDFVNKTLD